MVSPVTTTFYVYLLDEGTDCRRPVSAEHIRDDVYRIVGEPPDPEDEKWEYLPGALGALSPAESFRRRLSCRIQDGDTIRKYVTRAFRGGTPTI